MDNENKKYEEDFRTVSMTSIFNSVEFEKPDKLYSIDDDVLETEVTVVPVVFNQPDTPKPLKQVISFGNVVVPETVDENQTYNQPLENDVIDEDISLKESISFENKKEDIKEEASTEEEVTLLESVNIYKADQQQEELNEEIAFCQPDSQPNKQVEEEIEQQEPEITKKFDTITEQQIVDDILEKIDEVENKQLEKPIENTINTESFMTEKETEKEVHKEKLGFNWFFWLSFVVVLIPIGFFGWILYSASVETHIPIIGSRLNNSISVWIDDTKVTTTETKISKLAGVQKAAVTLNVATLRITIDVDDSYTEEQIKQLALSCYEVVNEELPIKTYFSGQGSFKQYDLEINLYNNLDSENLVIVTLIKNTKMEEYKLQVVTTPVNKYLADQLKGKE